MRTISPDLFGEKASKMMSQSLFPEVGVEGVSL